VWNEEFVFDVHSLQSTCVVRLFDHDPVDTDDPIGQVPVTHLIGGDEFATASWFAIQESPGGPTSKLGELKLDIRWLPNLDAPNYEPEASSDAIADASPDTGLLLLTVIEAEGLKKMDLFGQNDVYVSASLKKTESDVVEQRTSTIEGGGSAPRWKGGQGETLSFEGVDPDSLPKLGVSVFDEDKGGDDLIGQCYVSLDELTASDEEFVDIWKDLTTEKGPRGRLRLVLQWRADLLS
jgi:Ca2+-dependent lipid-binding protein